MIQFYLSVQIYLLPVIINIRLQKLLVKDFLLLIVWYYSNWHLHNLRLRIFAPYTYERKFLKTKGVIFTWRMCCKFNYCNEILYKCNRICSEGNHFTERLKRCFSLILSIKRRNSLFYFLGIFFSYSLPTTIVQVIFQLIRLHHSKALLFEINVLELFVVN